MSVDLVILTNTAGPVWQRSIGAYQVASHCRDHGFSCQVIDFTDHFSLEEINSLLDKFVDQSTLAIGVSTSFYFNETTKKKFISADRNFETVIPTTIRQSLEQIKSKYPGLKLLAGGAQSHQIKNDSLFDAIFHGYSEQSVVEYLINIKKKTKRIWPMQGTTSIIDGAADHFDIEHMDHKWHKHDCVLPKETLPIEISRGCIFKCKFCAYPLNGKKKFDYLRDPEHIKNELVKNYELYGTTNYYFTDDTFNDSTFKLERLHQAITSLPFKIKFVTYLRLDLIYHHKEQINLLYEMGLGSAFFGIETLNHRTGKVIGKGMSPTKVKDFLLDLHDNQWKKEIPITCSFIIGLPHDTENTIRQTHEWCQQSPINDVWFPLFIRSDTHYKSEFDINFAQYGYTIDSDGHWYNDNFTYSKALELAEEFNAHGLYGKNTPSTWFLFALLSYGYDIKDLKNIPASDLPWRQYARDKKRLFEIYKTMIFNL
jgi:tRNA A37 methylthiotransferase MiaB